MDNHFEMANKLLKVEWADQQYVANEAAEELEKLITYLTAVQEKEYQHPDYDGIPSIQGMDIITAALTMLREVILNQYGLSKEDLLATDYDDFVEFVVNEANQ